MLGRVVVENGVKKIVPLTADCGSGNPCGAIITVYQRTVPNGYLPLGAQYDITQFPVLYSILGTDTIPTASALGLPTLTTGQYVIKATSGINENQADNVLSALSPVDVVALNNVHSVTSGAVYAKGNDIETFELTASDFASSITDLTIRFAKGYYNPLTHIVSLSIDIYSASNLIPVINNIICNIPNIKYRPRYDIEGYAVLINESSEIKYEAIRIQMNGNISLGNFLYGNHPTKAVAFTMSYFAN